MSTEAGAAPEAVDHDEHHPTPKTYWIIAALLAGVTAFEVAIAYASDLGNLLIPILLIAAALKFGLVIGYFMHLKFDTPLFTRFFLVGLTGAIILFVVVLATFQAL